MTTFYSTFAPGLQKAVKDALTRQLGDARVELLLDGLVVYRTSRSLEQIKRIRFFNNTFLLLRLFKDLHGGEALPFMMRDVMRHADALDIPPAVTEGARFYRITASRHNQTTPIDRDLLGKLERVFSLRLGLRIHRTLPDVEVWFLERSEGIGLAGIRLTRRAATEKDLQPGELKPELANILCWISEPTKEDIFLDPFAGSGAIPLERARSFPYKHIFASDADPNAVSLLRARAARAKLKLSLEHSDARHLRHLADGSVDRIVTDPPWGMFAAPQAGDPRELYPAMLREFRRALKPGGIAVVLMGQKEAFEAALRSAPALKPAEKYDILVSGKKAAIYKLKG